MDPYYLNVKLSSKLVWSMFVRLLTRATLPFLVHKVSHTKGSNFWIPVIQVCASFNLLLSVVVSLLLLFQCLRLLSITALFIKHCGRAFYQWFLKAEWFMVYAVFCQLLAIQKEALVALLLSLGRLFVCFKYYVYFYNFTLFLVLRN